MRVYPGEEPLSLSITDPSTHRTVSTAGFFPQLKVAAAEARREGKHLCWHYSAVANEAAGKLGSRLERTEIPPAFSEPFRSGSKLYEVIIVMTGEITIIESSELSNSELATMSSFDLSRLGARTISDTSDLAVMDPSARFAIVNRISDYATYVVIRVKDSPNEPLAVDWRHVNP